MSNGSNSVIASQSLGVVPASLTSSQYSSRPRRKRDRVAKQQALMQAALRLFAAKGYDATTTREIAASAGCAEGLIHRYFKGKAGLLPALVEHSTSSQAADPGRYPVETLDQDFLQLVSGEVERCWEKRDFLRTFVPRAMVDPSVADTMERAFLSSRTAEIAARLRQHAAHNGLSVDQTEVLAQAAAVFGLMFGFMAPVVLGHDQNSAKAMAASLARILIRGSAR